MHSFLYLLQHQQQAQQLLLQQQRRQPPALPPHQHQPHQRRQQQPQRQPLPLRPLQPQLLRVRTSINKPHQQSVRFLFLLATTTTTRLYFELLRGKKHERLSAALDLDKLELKISPSAANLPAACSSYTTISDATRSVTYTTFVGCDSSSFSSSGQWVRFTGSGGTTIPTYAPGTSVCGTSATGWYASALPSSGATVSGTLCYDWSNTCTWSTSIQVANCNTYYVYLLYPSPVCNLRVCTV
ncbi:unnamed protein product [Rotaria socialis]|uniref:Uncharacterized protein n=1 Tax=Rotaria socialis TaxID=392032 RepID=A0A820V2L3_9BILA|nr:unnamed protein product [Rotaria socialis]